MKELHQAQSVLEIGDLTQNTKRIVILLHGRGATSESMVSLSEAIEVGGTRFYIPQAASNTWYPQTAFGPLEVNEPYLSSALKVVGDLIKQARLEGFSDTSIYLGGFSQGACLAAEYLVRNPARIGGLFVLSGALIGPQDQPRHAVGDLQGTPVFIGGSDNDPWVKTQLAHEAARVFTELGAQVDLEIYPGIGHTIIMDEIKKIRGLLSENGSN